MDETSAAVQLFEMKSILRKKIAEYLHTAETVKQPQSRRWYRFLASEMEAVLSAHVDFVCKHPSITGADAVQALKNVFKEK